ncbi:helix-turn-helix domain-containing protein [Paenibacillus kobensis]|uniref:helix-turn-helix domain-containing protein n=1 Tax=Paenibacillus kobensis TaxID=59841 RepID=UPI000FD75977|nr:AraC family transcriptional regulator [Paenibacillus kobensis]
MQLNNYFERLNFNNGKKINVSKKVDLNFSGKMHWHPFVEILVSLYDNNEVTINYTKHVLKTNDLVIIYPGDLHSFDHIDENAFIIVQFPLDLLMIMGEFNTNISIFYQYHYIKYDPSNIDADRMIILIKQLPDLYDSDTLFNEVRIYSLLLEFFVMLGRYCVNAKKEGFSGDASTDYKATKLMAEACLYISQNCTSPLTLDDVSHHVGVSKYHFSRIFNKFTNMTFIDFLTTERIKRTESLILNPNARITDIAFESGFSSVSSFNRCFKKIKGISPSEFRETMIDNAFQSHP